MMSKKECFDPTIYTEDDLKISYWLYRFKPM